MDIPTIQKISGHKTLAMVMRYVHLSGEHIDNAIAAIDTGFLDTLTPEFHQRRPAGALPVSKGYRHFCRKTKKIV